MGSETRSKLCKVCKSINFASIFTPRESDSDTGKWTTLYRKELGGNGKSPGMSWGDHGYSIRTGPYKDTIPRIREADYDQLSTSTQSDDDQHEAPTSAPSGAALASIANQLDEINDPRDDDWKTLDGSEDGQSVEDETEAEARRGSVSTWSGNSHFTENTRIDPELEAEGNWGYHKGLLYYMGTVWDLRKRRRECDLCRILWRRLRTKPDIKTRHLSKSRCLLKLVDLTGRKVEDSNNEVSVLNLVFIHGYKLGHPKDWGWNIQMSFVLQGVQRDISESVQASSKDLSKPFDNSFFGSARLRRAVCDFDLFRKWLHTCETTHSHHMPIFEGDIFIRLIDVERLCLVEWRGPASKAPRFCSLSYVWGKQPHRAVLTTRNLEEARKPGYFDQPLGKTVVDSIKVMLEIRERYLWVDALCILQDSPEDKEIQLPQMHYIYGRAALTIVAAHGSDADAGLPGVQKDSRKGSSFRLELDGLRISIRTSVKVQSVHEDIGFNPNYLQSTAYQSRGWTFQEGYLSTRLLVFTKEQVYFECARCTWMEDTHWESNSVSFVGWKAFKETSPFDDWVENFYRRAYDIDSTYGDGRMNQANNFAALTKQYTLRQLTNENDILNAYLGVLSSIRKQEDADFFKGLRTRYFGNDLLFNATEALERRFSGLSSVDSGFPTWSWTAWRGPIEIPNDAKHNSEDLVRNLVPCDGVKCYKLDRANGKDRLELINETGGWRFVKGYVRKGESIYDLTKFHVPSKHDNEDELSQQKQEEETESEASDIDASLRIVSSIFAQRYGVTRSRKKVTHTSGTIPRYDQEITLSEIKLHPAYSQIVPNFHIMFRTFSSIVVLVSEYDEFSDMVSGMRNTMGGTHAQRVNGIMSNTDSYQRNIYACKKRATSDSASSIERTTGPPQDSEVCPCCGKVERPPQLPDNLQMGPYIGRLPQRRDSWNVKEYKADIPDGIYLLLWMNNNQLPMFGHLLCKPVSNSASEDGMWDGLILQRVCGAVGPPGILRRDQQTKYCAEWGTFVLA